MTFSAPASIAVSKISSSETASDGYIMTPKRRNMKETEFVSPREPPYLEKAARISEAVRLRLSVNPSTITATPAGPYPS